MRTSATGPAASAPLLLRHADIAMYRAKRQRSGWAAWDPQVDAAAQVRLRDIEQLTRALAGDELEATMTVAGVRPAAGASMLTLVTEVTTTTGEPRSTVTALLVHR